MALFRITVKQSKNTNGIKLEKGRISDLCPTMLDIMGIEKPAEMTGNSLIVK